MEVLSCGDQSKTLVFGQWLEQNTWKKMPILRANILSGPLASIPSRPVSSIVVRKERVNFLFVWIHFHASGKSISPSHAFFQWLVPDARSSLCAGSLNLCLPLPGALSGSHPSASRASHASGFTSSEWPFLTPTVTSSVPSELSLPHWTLFFFFATVETFAKVCVRTFPSDPVVKILPCSAGDAGLIPDQGTKIPHISEQQSLSTTTTESMSRKEDPTQPK